jgi:hypothetical protein
MIEARQARIAIRDDQGQDPDNFNLMSEHVTRSQYEVLVFIDDVERSHFTLLLMQ